MILLNDLTPSAIDPVGPGGADDGWAGLMQLAAAFPLDLLSFCPAPALCTFEATADMLPQPRRMRYDLVIDLVDGAGDGPLIGLCAGV